MHSLHKDIQNRLEQRLSDIQSGQHKMVHCNLMSQVQQRGATWSWDKFILHLTLKSFVDGVLMDMHTDKEPFAITYFSDDTDSGSYWSGPLL
jgi:hypothetical protein